ANLEQCIRMSTRHFESLFFFNDTLSTDIYTLSLHDALPIFGCAQGLRLIHRQRMLHRQLLDRAGRQALTTAGRAVRLGVDRDYRSEEHTSELQSRENLVCRLLLEKKNIKRIRLRLAELQNTS